MTGGSLQEILTLEVLIMVAVGVMLAAAALTGLMFVGLRYKRQRDHINSKILPLHQEITAENVALMLNQEHEGEGRKGKVLSVAWLDLLIVHSGKKIGTGRLIFMMLAIAVGTVACSVPVGFSPLVGFSAALVLGPGLPVMVLKFLKSRRMKKFSFQFTEAIELIVRSLKAGHPVPTAIQMVAREMPDPIGTEFGLVASEVSYGSDLVTAIKGLLERIPDEDLPLFITAISIQSTTGGNLSVILSGLATVLRQRVKLRRKVKAAAAEGRASALILNAVPVAVMLFISLITPDYYGEIIHENFIIIGLTCAFGWMMIGNLAMYKMMHFKV